MIFPLFFNSIVKYKSRQNVAVCKKGELAVKNDKPPKITFAYFFSLKGTINNTTITNRYAKYKKFYSFTLNRSMML